MSDQTHVLTPELRALVDELAELYVLGRVSSADAFRRIDRAIGAGWHGNPTNAAREHFDWCVERHLDRVDHRACLTPCGADGCVPW